MLVCSVQVISRIDSQSKFHMFSLFSGRNVGVLGRYTNIATKSILGSENFVQNISRDISCLGKRTNKHLEKSHLH